MNENEEFNDYEKAYDEFISKQRSLLRKNMGGGDVYGLWQPDVQATAKKLVEGPRQKTYGSPKVNSGRIAKIWSAILKTEVTQSDVALCLIGLKLARLIESPSDTDTQVDVVGYVRYLQEILKEEK